VLSDEEKSEPWTSPSCPWADILSCPAHMQGCPEDRPVMTGMHLAMSQSSNAFTRATTSTEMAFVLMLDEFDYRVSYKPWTLELLTG
jgi:hypothetical protein